MVQVLPYVPGFGEQLAQALTTAAGNVAEGFSQRKARMDLEKLLNPQGQQVQAGTPMEKVNNTAGNPLQPNSQISPLKLMSIGSLAEKAYGKNQADILTKSLLEQQKQSEKEAQEIRAENRKRQGEFFSKEQANTIGKRDAIRRERNDLKLGLQAVQEGNVGGFDVNYLASLFGAKGEPLKTAKGVQLESAMKNLLIDSIQKLQGRPNQWVETQIKSATAGIGKSLEANETLIEMGLANLDIEEKMLDVRDELVSYYEKNGIIPPSNLDKTVHEILKPYAEQRFDKLSYDLRVLYEREQGPRSLISLQKVKQGTPLTRERAQALAKKYGSQEEAIKKAKQLGYSIPSKETVEGPPIEPQAVNE